MSGRRAETCAARQGMGWGEALHCLGDWVSNTLTARFCFLLLTEGAVNRTFLGEKNFLLLTKRKEGKVISAAVEKQHHSPSCEW